jgi:hypothetical protein
MKDTKFRILLDIHEVRSQVTIPVKVGDVSCKIYITLVEGGKPYKIHENSFGVFTGQKGDDNYLFNNCVIENGVIRYDFTPQTVAAAGILECEVRIYDEDGGVLTTPSFTIVVDERAVKDSDLASGTEFTFLDEIIVNEGQRMENERNRIEAFNNMELTVEDKGDNYLLTKTNKDGSKEEFPIGKGEDYEITPEDYQAIADKVVKDNLDSQAAEYFENLDARATEFLEDVKNQNKDYIEEATELTSSASGSAITIESANAPLQNLKLFGKTEQDGTPTPDAPIPLISVGDSGSFEVGVYGGKNLLPNNATSATANGITFTVNADKSVSVSGTPTAVAVLTLPITLPKGTYILSGAPRLGGNAGLFLPLKDSTISQLYEEVTFTLTETLVSEVRVRIGIDFTAGKCTFYPMIRLATETDSTYEPCNKQTLTMPYTLRSVSDIKDEVDFNRGVLIQRYKELIINETFGLSYDTNNARFYKYGNTGADNWSNNKISTHYVLGETGSVEIGGMNNTFNMGDYAVYIKDTRFTNVTDFNNWLASNNVSMLYKLATPIETPLSETELNAYRQLMTNSGTTTILSEANMTLDYYTPKGQALGNIHSQMNKDYFKLTQAIIETGGN